MNRKDHRKFIAYVKKNMFDNELKRYIFSKIYYFNDYSYKRLINGLSNNKGLFYKIEKAVIPTNLNDLLNYQVVVSDLFDITSIFEVTMLLLTKYKNKINSFLELKKVYEDFIYRCEYLKAKNMLDKIDREVCISFWSISQRFIVEESLNGLEGNKKLLDEYLSKIKNKNINSTIIDFFSILAEKNTSLNNYQERLERFLLKIKNTKSLYCYFGYKFNTKYEFEYSDVAVIMQIESQLSIIDMYEAIVSMLSFDASSERKFVDLVPMLSNNITDNRIRNISVIEGLEYEIGENPQYNEIMDSYTKGEYENVIGAIENYHLYYHMDFQLVIMYVKSHVYLSRQINNSNMLINALYNIYSMNDKYTESTMIISSLLKQYMFLEWGIKLKAFIFRKNNVDNDKKLMLMSFICDDVLSPSISRFIIQEEKRAFYLEQMIKRCPVTAELYKSIINETEIQRKDVERNRKLFYNALIIQSSNVIYSNRLLEELSDQLLSNQLYYEEKISRMLFVNYLKLNNISKCMTICVGLYIKNTNIIKRLPLDQVIEKMNVISDESYYKLIEYPIFVYIYRTKDNNDIRYAYQNFLDAHSINLVTDIIHLSIFKFDLLVFFLYHICTIEVLKKDVNIHINRLKPEDVRIRILRHLCEVDVQHRRVYENEISEITQKIEINNRAEQINKSRIHVEVEKIFDEIKSWLSESYDMYLRIKNFDLSVNGVDINSDSISVEFDRYTQEINDLIRNEPLVSQEYILFSDIVTKIAEEFLYNSNFGLESFLSSRIRHGFLKDHLIKVFNEHGLISKSEEDESKQYMYNDFLSERISNDNILKEFLSVFSDFTARIERKINEINSEWIRIRYKKDEVGLFDFTSFKNSVSLFLAENITDYSVLFDMVIELLWSIVNNSLKKIKAKIDNELKLFFEDALIQLENNVKKYEREYPELVSEINQKINLCKSKIVETICEFKEVFNVETNKYKDYTLYDLISTAKQINRQLFARFDEIEFVQNVKCEKMMKGTYFPFLVDIICIMINNAINHSGLDIGKLKININMFTATDEIKHALSEECGEKWDNIQNEDELLVIEVINNLKCDDLEKLRNNIGSTFDNLNKPEVVKKYAQKEGGSGLYKIYQRLKYNIPSPYVIIYKIDENQFCITLVIGMNSI